MTKNLFKIILAIAAIFTIPAAILGLKSKNRSVKDL